MNRDRIDSASREPVTGKVPLPGKWALQAACVGKPTNWWYPGEGQPRATAAWARDICRRCPVAGPCLDHALRYHEAGIWGGLDRAQRRRMTWKARKRARYARERETA